MIQWLGVLVLYLVVDHPEKIIRQDGRS